MPPASHHAELCKSLGLWWQAPQCGTKGLHVLTFRGLISSILCLSLSGSFCSYNLKWPTVPTVSASGVFSNCLFFVWSITSHPEGQHKCYL
jgi:hypothetical protein